MAIKFQKQNSDYGFMSNFYPCTVVYEGVTYKSSEAAFQAYKSGLPQDRLRFSLMKASESKYAGNRVKMRPDWETFKFEHMYNVCLAKFSQNPNLRDLLIATGDEELIENTYWHDQCWGICSCELHNGKGKNNLGKILMRIRTELREEQEKKGESIWEF